MPDLRFSEEQDELRSIVRSMLDKRSDSAAVRTAIDSEAGYDESLWQALCEQVGVAALPVPEEHDGAGAGFGETSVVLEEIGHALAPSPLLASTVAAQALLGGSSDAAARLLPRVAAGEVATLAWAGATGGPDVEEPVVASPASGTGRDHELNGTVDHVLDGTAASVLLVAARTPDGPALFEVDPSQVTREAQPAMDLTLRLARITLDGTPATRIGGPDALARAHTVGSAAVAAVAVGVAQRGLDMTVDYVKQREQFGRPIGSFQAVKHRLADLHVLVETSRSAALAAAVAVDDAVAGGAWDQARRSASVAQAWCSDAVARVAAETVQLHGGIAITWEHDAHLVLKQAQTLGILLGPARAHRSAVLASL
ncbi:acyl-CoA dehydrogenase family protein [Nocardioides marmoribigeumensis]|uniref:Alkylation response protein AidB-like acyl-CoA dehydrogenase n=1 Tax=Nocardioides marmoribigeumensis TaxID=433649 RepID=A0ABU2C1N8_9ACTN|nr:acyl-CoA dehydrogenase family protein [Nocardioides marmoribigeumensis]MDR7364588.1 alkylation response protein AidB-like acyl-CoA dehydrogenase [Nocardioides marmoribigeumensis]